MARRKSRKPARRNKYKNAFNIKNAAFGYLGASVLTSTFFNQDPLGFVMGRTSSGLSNFGPSSGISNISIKEMFTWSQYGHSRSLSEQITKNLEENWAKGLMGLAGIAVSKKLITSMGVSRSFNNAVRGLGMGSLVKM